jgi:hypothetical protein
MKLDYITQESMSYVENLPKEINKLIGSFLPNWKQIPVWKHRFMQDVLPYINESHYLVVRECTNCHFYGNLDMDLCLRCTGWDANSTKNTILMSSQQYYELAMMKRLWMDSVFGVLFTFWLQDKNKNPQLYFDWNQSDKMGFAIRQTRLFRRFQYVETVIDTDVFLMDIVGLLD